MSEIRMFDLVDGLIQYKSYWCSRLSVANHLNKYNSNLTVFLLKSSSGLAWDVMTREIS